MFFYPRRSSYTVDMWITVLGVHSHAIKSIVNKTLENKGDNLAAEAPLWILAWKDRVFHRQKVKNARFLFCTDLSTHNQYLGGDRC